MKVIPYASAIGSIKYATLYTRPIVYLAMSLARGYNSDLGVDHQIAVKIILRYLKRTKEIFLGYGGDKEFVLKSYVDASFDTDLDESKSQSRYMLNMGAISQSSSMQSIVDIEICKVHTDLNVSGLLTKLLSQAKHDHTLVLFGC